MSCYERLYINISFPLVREQSPGNSSALGGITGGGWLSWSLMVILGKVDKGSIPGTSNIFFVNILNFKNDI